MSRTASIVLGVALVLGSAIPAFAAQPARECPNPTSGWSKVDRDGWWAASVEGFAIAGITVFVGGDATNGYTAEFDELAAEFGFADGAAFHDFILGEQWDGLNPNGDDYVCMKAVPINAANPGYLFSSIDNVAR
jgi:hypothetical protein